MFSNKLENLQVIVEELIKNNDFQQMWQSTMCSLEKEDQVFADELEKHVLDVASATLEIAEGMGESKERKIMAVAAGLLHDNGKHDVPREVLHKKGKLTAEEIAEIKKHPVLGSQRIRKVDSTPFWDEVAVIVEQHHEDYNPDGYPENNGRFKGYPNKVTGKDIHLLAAIVSVADWYVSCCEDRSYRPGMDKITALKETMKVAGARLHPQVFYIFVHLPKMENVPGIEEVRKHAKMISSKEVGDDR